MKHGSLFSGIGGFDLAAEWMGWENVFHCEWNTFGQKVLKYYWPKSISYADICKTNFTIHRGEIDILTGGFPCQPYSSAGKRKGKDDERHLWPQMLRAIREIAPSWVVGENVYGLVNWSGGLVFHEVQADLEAEGYEVFPFLLPAVSVNAPHRRDRIWFVAHSKNNGCCREPKQWKGVQNDKWVNSQCKKERRNEIWAESKRCDESRIIANSNNNALNERNSTNEVNASERGKYALGNIEQMGKSYIFNSKCIGWDEKSNENGIIKESQQEKCRQEQFGRTNSSQSRWWGFPSVSPICIGDDGLSDRLDSITFPKWRNESIKAGGNAIVPQVVYQIFKSIEQYERFNGRTNNEGGDD